MRWILRLRCLKMAPGNLVNNYRNFAWICNLHMLCGQVPTRLSKDGGSWFLSSVGTYLPKCKLSLPKRPWFQVTKLQSGWSIFDKVLLYWLRFAGFCTICDVLPYDISSVSTVKRLWICGLTYRIHSQEYNMGTVHFLSKLISTYKRTLCRVFGKISAWVLVAV
jgi:hypothetical protein